MTRNDNQPSNAGEDEVLPMTNPQVVFCAVEDGAVLLSTADEVYFGLNEVGTRIWELIGEGRDTVRGILDAILGEYSVEPAEAERALLDLLAELAAKGLIEASPGV